MPFKRIRDGRYTRDGKVYTPRQVRAYYATRGFKRQPRKRR